MTLSRVYKVFTGFVPLLTVVSLWGCSDLTGSAELPDGIPDPRVYRTEAGALQMYQGVVATFEPSKFVGSAAGGGMATPSYGLGAFAAAVWVSGVFTDELQPAVFGGPPLAYALRDPKGFALDARNLPEMVSGPATSSVELQAYGLLQDVRAKAGLGAAALRTYAPNVSPALQGHLYALAGYAEVLLADLYCSGVPLSTVDFEGDFTYRAGVSTIDLYRHAIALFDTAITLTVDTDSTRFLNFARVGQGRAFLALGIYDSAAFAVSSVPDTFRYQVDYDFANMTGGWGGPGSGSLFDVFLPGGITMSNHEGGNGLPYVESGDPRTETVAGFTNEYGAPWHFPRKYRDWYAVSAMTVADGVEARLIQVEADVRAGRVGAWLNGLNRLRANANDPRLPPLEDPGNDDARIDRMFSERAAWLFLTGHRQGDLRRRVRNDHRPENAVYPAGSYPAAAVFQRYGTDVTLPIPAVERVNKYFMGCLSRGA